jgi:hypothetical protein
MSIPGTAPSRHRCVGRRKMGTERLFGSSSRTVQMSIPGTALTGHRCVGRWKMGSCSVPPRSRCRCRFPGRLPQVIVALGVRKWAPRGCSVPPRARCKCRFPGQLQQDTTALGVGKWGSRSCSVLLAHGANVDSRDGSNKTPLHWALENGHLEVVRFLLAHGANVDSRDSSNKTPLHWASENGHLEVVQSSSRTVQMSIPGTGP